jgi:hypothetical protein
VHFTEHPQVLRFYSIGDRQRTDRRKDVWMDVQTDKWMSIKQWRNDSDIGKQKWLGKSLLHYQFVHHTFPVDWPVQNWASMRRWWLSILANQVYLTQQCSKHLWHCTKAHIIYTNVRTLWTSSSELHLLCFLWVLQDTICPFYWRFSMQHLPMEYV